MIRIPATNVLGNDVYTVWYRNTNPNNTNPNPNTNPNSAAAQKAKSMDNEAKVCK